MMQIFNELFSFENQTGPAKTPANNYFVNKGAWYVNRRYMQKVFLYPFISSSHKIPGLYRTKIFGLMKNLVLNSGKHAVFPSSADAIQIKHTGERLRAFYDTDTDKRYSIKIVRDSDKHKFISATKHEVSVRKHLLSLGTINIPEIFYGQPQNNSYVLCEEMILGRRFNARFDRALYFNSMLPQLKRTYLAHGIKYNPFQDYLTPDIIKNIYDLADKTNKNSRFLRALQRVSEKNPLTAVSLCHGGLGPCNLAVSRGKIYFLDWKYANEGPVIADMMRTAIKYPRLNYVFESIREIIINDFMDKKSNFNDLFTACIALEINRVPKSSPRLIHFWRRLVPPNYSD